MPGGYHLTFEATERFSSAYYLTAVDDDLARQKTYSRLDGRITFGLPARDLNVSVIGRNLTNQQIRTFAAPLATSNGSFVQQQEMPRWWGVQVDYHFR